MNSLVTFNFKDNQVRTEIIDGQVWFSLADCCRALAIANSRTSVKLPQEGVGKTYTLTNGGKQEITIINEPNLYRLIFRSNKPQAQAFADWVYNEVLPSIRKTGSYGVPTVSLTQDRVALKAIGGLVKKCTAVAVREELKDVLSKEVKEVIKDQFIKFSLSTFACAEDLKPFQQVTDDMLLRGLFNWYSTRHHKLLDTVKELDEENGKLKSKIATIKKTIN